MRKLGADSRLAGLSATLDGPAFEERLGIHELQDVHGRRFLRQVHQRLLPMG
ncbi:MAG: hypothetical protein JO168_07035 [Solirubrobacterales bacterium]|nr:hypothetical protein [Solirubrobacterales bacterium]